MQRAWQHVPQQQQQQQPQQPQQQGVQQWGVVRGYDNIQSTQVQGYPQQNAGGIVQPQVQYQAYDRGSGYQQATPYANTVNQTALFSTNANGNRGAVTAPTFGDQRSVQEPGQGYGGPSSNAAAHTAISTRVVAQGQAGPTPTSGAPEYTLDNPRKWVGVVTELIPPNYGIVDQVAFYHSDVVSGPPPAAVGDRVEVHAIPNTDGGMYSWRIVYVQCMQAQVAAAPRPAPNPRTVTQTGRGGGYDSHQNHPNHQGHQGHQGRGYAAAEKREFTTDPATCSAPEMHVYHGTGPGGRGVHGETGRGGGRMGAGRGGHASGGRVGDPGHKAMGQGYVTHPAQQHHQQQPQRSNAPPAGPAGHRHPTPAAPSQRDAAGHSPSAPRRMGGRAEARAEGRHEGGRGGPRDVPPPRRGHPPHAAESAAERRLPDRERERGGPPPRRREVHAAVPPPPRRWDAPRERSRERERGPPPAAAPMPAQRPSPPRLGPRYVVRLPRDVVYARHRSLRAVAHCYHDMYVPSEFMRCVSLWQDALLAGNSPCLTDPVNFVITTEPQQKQEQRVPTTKDTPTKGKEEASAAPSTEPRTNGIAAAAANDAEQPGAQEPAKEPAATDAQPENGAAPKEEAMETEPAAEEAQDNGNGAAGAVEAAQTSAEAAAPTAQGAAAASPDDSDVDMLDFDELDHDKLNAAASGPPALQPAAVSYDVQARHDDLMQHTVKQLQSILAKASPGNKKKGGRKAELVDAIIASEQAAAIAAAVAAAGAGPGEAPAAAAAEATQQPPAATQTSNGAAATTLGPDKAPGDARAAAEAHRTPGGAAKDNAAKAAYQDAAAQGEQNGAGDGPDDANRPASTAGGTPTPTRPSTNDGAIASVSDASSGEWWSAKVLLLGGLNAHALTHHNHRHVKHLEDTLCLVRRRARGDLGLIGGAWARADGESPARDRSVLIKTAIRSVRDQTGIDLSLVSEWRELLELQYRRSSRDLKDAAPGALDFVQRTVVFAVPAAQVAQLDPGAVATVTAAKEAPAALAEAEKAKAAAHAVVEEKLPDADAAAMALADFQTSSGVRAGDPPPQLPADLQNLTVADLQAEMRKVGADTTWNPTDGKEVLIERLEAHVKAKVVAAAEVTDLQQSHTMALAAVAAAKASLAQATDAHSKAVAAASAALRVLDDPPPQHQVTACVPKGSDGNLKAVPLAQLLKYTPDDTKETRFEVSMAAEAMFEMLTMYFGRVLAHALPTVASIADKLHAAQKAEDEHRRAERAAAAAASTTGGAAATPRSDRGEDEDVPIVKQEVASASLQHPSAEMETSHTSVNQAIAESGDAAKVSTASTKLKPDPATEAQPKAPPAASGTNGDAGGSVKIGEKRPREDDAVSKLAAAAKRARADAEALLASAKPRGDHVRPRSNSGAGDTAGTSLRTDAGAEGDSTEQSMLDQLLCAGRWFDRGLTGYIEGPDVEDIVHLTHEHTSRRWVQMLVGDACKRGRFMYAEVGGLRCPNHEGLPLPTNYVVPSAARTADPAQNGTVASSLNAAAGPEAATLKTALDTARAKLQHEALTASRLRSEFSEAVKARDSAQTQLDTAKAEIEAMRLEISELRNKEAEKEAKMAEVTKQQSELANLIAAAQATIGASIAGTK